MQILIDTIQYFLIGAGVIFVWFVLETLVGMGGYVSKK